MIDQTTKEQIRTELDKYVSHIGSQKKAEAALQVSNAYISQILSGKDERVSDEMWRKLAAKLDIEEDTSLTHTVTASHTKLMSHLIDAKATGACIGVIGHPGSGKSHAKKKLKEQKNVVAVDCVELMKTRGFYAEILKGLGKVADSYNLYEIQQQAVKVILGTKNPILVVDELERVKNPTPIVSQLVDIYNLTEGRCSITLFGTLALEQMFTRNIKNNKPGWNTLFDRLNLKWIYTSTTENDALEIIKANGITDANLAYGIANDSINSFGTYSLRRVGRKIYAERKKSSKGRLPNGKV